MRILFTSESYPPQVCGVAQITAQLAEGLASRGHEVWVATGGEGNEPLSYLTHMDFGVGLNAATSMDDTVYYYSMPVNRLELWAYLESERFRHPVMREFYKERDVVYEERRMRVDSNPIGRMVEQFLAAAYVAHPYQRSGVGWPFDVSHLTATEAME